MGDHQRSFEGHMDWQYHNNQGPVDATSPFVQASQRSKMSSFASPSKFPGLGPNPFATTNASARQDNSGSPFRMQPPPQSTSAFDSSRLSQQQRRAPTAPAFRNASFTTPQRRVEELASEFSGAESSPAPTDTSEQPDDLAQMTITPATAARRNIFAATTAFSPSKPTTTTTQRFSGRGELPRAKMDPRQRDKVRKRRRQYGDRDVGSVRPRLNHESDESDSDWEEQDERDLSSQDGGWRKGGGRRRRLRSDRPGWFSSFLTTIHDHPNAPVILSWWIQFGINLFFALLGAMVFVALGSMVVSDFRFAAAEARSKLLAEMEACTHEYTKNRCAPRSERLPALAVVCDEWEACMSQDPERIKSMAISSKQMAVTINEFFNVLSFKAWGFILSLVIVFLLANNLGFNKFRQSMAAETRSPSSAAPSHPATMLQPGQAHQPPQLFPPQGHDPKQAFIWAPVTPKNLRRGLFLHDEATDTDDSPTSEVKAILPAPTPSARRSPSKGERERERERAGSPSKGRSPFKTL